MRFFYTRSAAYKKLQIWFNGVLIYFHSLMVAPWGDYWVWCYNINIQEIILYNLLVYSHESGMYNARNMERIIH